MNDPHPTQTPNPASLRRGFTLIEMMVSVTLVILIMLLFSQIFTIAAGSITDQRALANNSQRARTLSQVVRTDLSYLTFRQRRDAVPGSLIAGATGDPTGIVPLAPGDDVSAEQRGYLYVSENQPGDDTDDVLQFTIFIPDLAQVETTLRNFYGGRSQSLANLVNSYNLATPVSTRRGQYSQAPFDNVENDGTVAGGGSNTVEGIPNDPDADDGFGGPRPNNKTQSRAAEVSYFLRGGRLYRRVLLLRDASRPEMGRLAFGQPRLGDSGLGDRIFAVQANTGGTAVSVPGVYDTNPATAGAQGNFWTDFDLSATRVPFDVTSDGRPDGYGGTGSEIPDSAAGEWITDTDAPAGLWVNTVESLDNAVGAANLPIARPWMRFGHVPFEQFSVADNGLATDFSPYQPHRAGFPIEWGLDADDNPVFIGRLTHNETSYLATGGNGGVTYRHGFPGVAEMTSNSTDSRLMFTGRPFASSPTGLTVEVPDALAPELGNADDFVVTSLVPLGESGPRAGEDLVLSGVTAFDIELWDDGAGAWVDIGENAGGYYGTGNRTNVAINTTAYSVAAAPDGVQRPGVGVQFYGPSGVDDVDDSTSGVQSINNVFDTWHTHIDIGTDDLTADGSSQDGVYDLPPYRTQQVSHAVAMDNYLTQNSLANGGGGNTFPPSAPTNNDDVYLWMPRGGSSVASNPGNVTTNDEASILGTVTFANPFLPPYMAEVPDLVGTAGNSFDIPRIGKPGQALPGPLRNGSIAFRAVDVIDLGDLDGNMTTTYEQGDVQPTWPVRPGDRVRDGEIVWEAFDNRVGLKKMRITIRYTDPQSGNARQTTLVHSFVE